MQPSQYLPITISAATLTPVVIWLSHWPIQAPDQGTCGCVAALLWAAGASVHAVINKFLELKGLK